MSESAASVSDAELRASVIDLEAEIARLQYRQLTVLAELEARNVSGSLGLRGLVDLIMADLRYARTDARSKAQAVSRFGARRALTGDSLKPEFALVAEAFAAGEVGIAHASVIAETVEAIPQPTRGEHSALVERTLLEHAASTDPRTLRQLGQRILAHLDPDGPGPDERRAQDSRRRLTLLRNPDSSGSVEGMLTPACQAIWEAVLAPLAARPPDDALGEDTRTPGQRLHDAFEEAGRRLLAAGVLPDRAGMASQLVVTVGLTDLERRAGRATTHHGGTLSIDEALRLAVGGGLLPAVLDDTGGVLAYGRSRRLASTGQRGGSLRLKPVTDQLPEPPLHLPPMPRTTQRT